MSATPNTKARSLLTVCFWLFAASPWQAKASGTLVVLIPTQQGLVFAADSRTTVAETTCDQTFKITELKRRKQTALSVTGTGTFLPIYGSVQGDPCHYIKVTPPLLDIQRLVQEQLDMKTQALARHEISALAEKCRESVAQYAAEYKRFNPLEKFRGKEMFRVVIGSFDPHEKKSLIISFVIRIPKEKLEPETGEISWKEIWPGDKSDVFYYGETEYVDRYVYTVGRRYLGTFVEFVSNPKKVKDVTVIEAEAVAINLIEAASRTAETVPPPTGIGGPVDVVLLGTKRTPVRLKWKSN